MAQVGPLQIEISARLIKKGRAVHSQHRTVEVLQGARGRWRWHSYEWRDGEKHLRSESPVFGFATRLEAVEGARSELRPRIKFVFKSGR